ncbi:uncharacterized protein EKO05_0007980 [Ascochyta rabiei]|uniref:uncharacterized protein n=1 Tax=Didymella rabiei TaxID=5454 RepID=UPI0021FEFC91|nr:uncharacterized protein EKO05_0007980 [Ascochyta rabiei]UPX17638.1 hypothetical protein EKO05_0007980 [Ascochyta rabiei]
MINLSVEIAKLLLFLSHYAITIHLLALALVSRVALLIYHCSAYRSSLVIHRSSLIAHTTHQITTQTNTRSNAQDELTSRLLKSQKGVLQKQVKPKRCNKLKSNKSGIQLFPSLLSTDPIFVSLLSNSLPKYRIVCTNASKGSNAVACKGI